MGKWGYFLWGVWVWGQTILDAERWTQAQPMGTARAWAMGGAFSSLGGEPANLTQNPAGLGLFMRGGLWLSPSLSIPATTTSYITSTPASQTRLDINQFALVLHGRGGKSITHWNFGFGYNQEASFTQISTAKGFNARNSFTQAVAEQAENLSPAQLTFTPLLAYANAIVVSPRDTHGVIDPISSNPYRYRGVFYRGGILQEITTQEAGRINTWSIAAGLSYKNWLFLGASVLIRGLNYSKLYRLREIDSENRYDGQNNTVPAEEVTFREKYTSRGSGLGLALGVLIEPIEYLRVGMSFTTGSRFAITDEYNAEMEFILDDARKNTTSYQEPFQYNYRFSYPYRMSGGLSFILPGKGSISAEADFLDYRTTSFSASDYSYDALNEDIQKLFSSALNLRAGTEWLLPAGFTVRAGYAYYAPVLNTEGRQYYPDPLRYRELVTLDMNRHFIAGGAGYMADRFFMDLAYVYAVSAQKYLPYRVVNPLYAPAPVAVVRARTSRVVITMGFRF
ncbi:MAG: hypothetical protein NZ580_06275 [Bacteroidia bacterium]|nr:hypothetical protein [Bacteroidia bacterium]MDW8236470.1 hypothetical protein [Bacteroidia bacterium]